ncbi:MAG: hypothetical protein PF488_04155 [Patescibacteria group bacterium]|jgi:hypothetical protein|nr:hypothetical protein [Patescibacteria group bacterium]
MTNIEDKTFTEKFYEISEDARFFYSSELSGDAIVSLSKKYKLDENELYSLVFLLVNSNFNLELIKQRIKSMNLTGISAKNLWIDFLGYLVFPIEEYVKDKIGSSSLISSELKRLKAEMPKYQEIKEDLVYLIEEKNMEELEKALKEFEESVDPKEERDYVLDLMKSNVLEILSTESLDANLSLNRGLIYLLFNVDDFQDDAISVLRNNQDLIGKENIKLGDREVAPTVANWIKAFIKEEGSDMLDDLTLAKYLDRSENAKKLDDKHKKLLSSLLIFYKNINFFPDSMKNTIPENWQIFPFDNEDNAKFEDALNENKKKNEQQVVEQENEEDENENEKSDTAFDNSNNIDEDDNQEEYVDFKEEDNNEENDFDEDQEIKKEKREENKENVNFSKEIEKDKISEKQKNINHLKEELEKYEPMSLEYKAISSEIKRLEDRNN